MMHASAFRPVRLAARGLAVALLVLGTIAVTACNPEGGNNAGAGNGTSGNNAVDAGNGSNEVSTNGSNSGNAGGTTVAGRGPAVQAQIKRMREKAVEHLRGRYVENWDESSNDFNQWGPTFPGVGQNALVMAGLMSSPDPIKPSDAQIKATMDAMLGVQTEHGAFHSARRAQAVYETSCMLFALVRACKLDPDFAKQQRVIDAIRNAQGYLAVTQVDGTAEPGVEADYVVGEDDAWYGGWGYGLGRVGEAATKSPANMSTTNFALEALHDSGYEDQEVFERALRFLNRCQNATEVNTEAVGATPEKTEAGDVAYPGNDGGAMYSPGDSKASFETVDGQKIPRSYGSMTYTLLKCYLMADPDLSSARAKNGVAAVMRWIKNPDHIDFSHNIGMPNTAEKDQRMEGYFYFLWAAARAFAMHGKDLLVDANGEEHDWRVLLVEKFKEHQSGDGSWTNTAGRWEEAQSCIAGSYLLMGIDALVVDR